LFLPIRIEFQNSVQKNPLKILQGATELMEIRRAFLWAYLAVSKLRFTSAFSVSPCGKLFKN